MIAGSVGTYCLLGAIGLVAPCWLLSDRPDEREEALDLTEEPPGISDVPLLIGDSARSLH